jgi:hypothetical protein
VKKAADIPSWKPWNVPTAGLTPEKVVACHQSTLMNQIAAECDKQLALEGTNAEDAEGTIAEDAEGANAEAGVTKEKHNYQPWQWEVFVGLQRSMPDRSVAYAVAYAKQVMPNIFPHANLTKKTAEKWKKNVLALEAIREEDFSEAGNDPTKLKLDIRLSSLRKFVNLWMMQTLKKLDTPECVPNNLRGWEESGMLAALKDDMDEDHKDFKLAKELNANGESLIVHGLYRQEECSES